MKKSEAKFFFAFWSVMTMIYFSAQAVWAQAVQTIEVVSSTVSTLPPVAAVAVSHPSLDQAQAIVDQLSSGWVMTVAILLIEILMRAFKTKDPKSLLYVLANIFKMIARVFGFLAEAADKVLQRTKEKDPA